MKTDYINSTVSALAGSPEPGWLPASQLNRTDADVSLFILTPNSIRYDAPVDDPWFSAHREINQTIDTVLFQFWITDYFVHVLGCIDQHQFCNPNSKACTPLAGWFAVNDSLQSLEMNEYQLRTASLIGNATATYLTSTTALGLGSSALVASNTVFGLDQAPLPNNQWTAEVSFWFAVSLANLQHFVVDYASGPFVDPLLGGRVINDGTAATQFICQNQKILSNGEYQNFSVLGLCCVLIFGGIIILVSLVLETEVGWAQRKLRHGQGKRILWIVDSDFQIQRMLYENSGYGDWLGHLNTVPTVAGTEKLQVLSEVEGGKARLPRREARGMIIDEDLTPQESQKLFKIKRKSLPGMQIAEK